MIPEIDDFDVLDFRVSENVADLAIAMAIRKSLMHPGDRYVFARLRKRFDPSQPRDDIGRWVEVGAISLAANNPAAADTLRAAVTNPVERRKLDAAIVDAQRGGGQSVAGGFGSLTPGYSRDNLVRGLEQWMVDNGVDGQSYTREAGYAQLPPSTIVAAVAEEQQSKLGVPADAATLASYDEFKKDILSQYDAVRKAGLEVFAWEGEGEPYHRPGDPIWSPNSNEMRRRVEAEGKFFFFMTENGFGAEGAGESTKHPLLEMSPATTSDGKPMLYNDVFRVVHDAVAHINGEFSFSTRGEYNAMLAHASTLPREAWPALFAETFGQNAVYELTGKFAEQNTYSSKFVQLIDRGLSQGITKSMVDPMAMDLPGGDSDLPLGAGRLRRQQGRKPQDQTVDVDVLDAIAEVFGDSLGEDIQRQLFNSLQKKLKRESRAGANWDESKVVRDDIGRFAEKASQKEAVNDKAKAAALFARVTDPAERAKLENNLRGFGMSEEDLQAAVSSAAGSPPPADGGQPPADGQSGGDAEGSQPVDSGEASKTEGADSQPVSGKWDPEWQETVDPQAFIDARNKSKHAEFLSPVSAEDLAGHKLYLSADGTVGAAVTADGDIQNVFNNGGPKGAGTDAMLAAIGNGGKTLDCYDDFLPAFYQNFGFTETGRMKFNREFAPEGWDYEKLGEPDVVFMARTNEVDDEQARANVQRGSKSWEVPERSTDYTDDWDAAKQRSAEVGIARTAQTQQGAGANGAGDQSSVDAGGDAGTVAPDAGDVPPDGGTVAPTPGSPRARYAAESASKFTVVDINGRDTLHRYARNPEDPNNPGWNDDRVKKHSEIEAEILNGVTPVPNGQRPIGYVLGGGPASGKSSIIKNGFVKLPESIAKIDSDHIKSLLPDYAEMVATGDVEQVGKAAAFNHEESSYLSKKIVKQSIESRFNTLLDGTGNGSYHSLKNKVNAMRANGMQVVGQYVTVDTEEAVRRSNARAEKTGRKVPESVIRKTHEGVSAVLPRAAQEGIFDEWQLWDTDGGGDPRLVAEGKKKEGRIANPELWGRFLKKAGESTYEQYKNLFGGAS